MLKQEEIRKERIRLGISQSKLATLTGVSKYAISSYELSKDIAPAAVIKSISEVLTAIDEGTLIPSKKKRVCKTEFDTSIIKQRPRRGYTQTESNKEYLKVLGKLSEDFSLPKTNCPKAISFFAGCGGLCYGLSAAGFDIVASNELVPDYVKIYKKNFPNTTTLPNDVKDITQDNIKAITDRVGDIDLFAGGPPCQGFSLAGKRDVNDSRNTLFQYYLRLASICKPKVILMENVKLLTSMKTPSGSYVKDEIIQTFNRIGYYSNFFIVNASDYGVPQDRYRVLFVGVRKDLKMEPAIPPPDHGEGSGLFDSLAPKLTFADAVSDLPFLEAGEKSGIDSLHKATKHPEHVIRWLIDVPEGKSAHDNTDPALIPPSGFNTTYKRQVWNEPGRTVTTNFATISGSNNVHPIATRALTTREAMRLQSFPDTYIMEGKDATIQTVIGNAVPPLLAYKIGKFLLENYKLSKL